MSPDQSSYASARSAAESAHLRMLEPFIVQQVLSRYVRASDARDGRAVSRLFHDDGRIEIFHRRSGVPALLAEIRGAKTIGRALCTLMKPHVSRAWSHHTTHDAIVDVLGDTARIDAQFIVFETFGAAEPLGGWSCDATGAQGSVRSTDAGYYCVELRKADGRWKIETMRIVHDLPFALPHPL